MKTFCERSVDLLFKPFPYLCVFIRDSVERENMTKFILPLLH